MEELKLLNIFSSFLAMKPEAKPKVYTLVALALTTCLTACVAPPHTEPVIVQPVAESTLNNAPQLKRFNHFEIDLQGGGTSNAELKTSGSLSFQASAAAFDVATVENSSAGRLFVQPDACRDDPSEACARRFIISGRLNVFKSSINCYISVRNDTALGYEGQSLTGLCQDRNSRGYSITLFSQ